MRIPSLMVCLWLSCSPIVAEELLSHSWGQWRGPTRDGQVVSADWPTALSGDRLQLIWRVELGPSYSGPILGGDKVFTTETVSEARELVHALDRRTGQKLWSAGWEGALSVPFFARDNGSWIRSTPAFDGQSLYVAGIRDVLVCLDAASGGERWRVDFVARYKTPLPTFGFVSSPLIDSDFLYVQAGGGICKLEKGTGREVWRALEDRGGMMGSAFSSPILADVAGARQLVVQTRSTLAGLDPSTGGVLWSRDIPAFQAMNILTPTVVGDTVFTSTYGGRSFLFEIRRQRDTFQIEELWNNKVQGYMSSPLVIDGHLYLHLRNQRFICLELASGKQKWITKERFGKYWSMVAQGNLILALDEVGILYLIRANPTRFELLDSKKISDQSTWAHLAVVGDEIFVRELNGLAAYRWR